MILLRLTNGIRCADCSTARGFVRLGWSAFSLAPTANCTQSLPALVVYLRYDASQSLYSGCQTFVNSQTLGKMPLNWFKYIDKKEKILYE